VNAESVPLLLIGLSVVTVGVLVIGFRKPLSRFVAEQLSANFGRASTSAVRRSTPGRTAFTGAGSIFIGGAFIVISIFR
jgi:hypothetical protein